MGERRPLLCALGIHPWRYVVSGPAYAGDTRCRRCGWTLRLADDTDEEEADGD